MRKNKVLEYLKRDGIESELECMTKEDFNTSELEYLSKYYHLQLQDSVNTMTYVISVNALVLSVGGMILNVLTNLSTVSGWIGNLSDICIFLSALLLSILAIYILCRTIKANKVNVKWQNKIMAIELLLGMNTENNVNTESNENIENIDKKE